MVGSGIAPAADERAGSAPLETAEAAGDADVAGEEERLLGS